MIPDIKCQRWTKKRETKKMKIAAKGETLVKDMGSQRSYFFNLAFRMLMTQLI